MTFLSFAFMLFVASAVLVFQLAPARFRPHVLLLASALFYASRSLSDALILLLITGAVYWAALALERGRSERSKLWLVSVSVTLLVVCLAGFKLASALSSTLQATTEASQDGPALSILVPLGLSYYLFKLIGYLLDVYWEKSPAQRSLLALALYASFFPQIVSGPIQRADDFFAQLARLDRLDPSDVAAGLRRILFGLFKKLAIADRLANAVDAVHSAPGSYSSLELLLGAYLFALQLYADFSGVTDIAIGLGQLFGIKGPENFDLPFWSRNLQEYWRRWHMSLTSWLADYVFTPLRMALRDRGQLGLSIAILTNMVAIGVWHGASWTYAAFGLMHGVFMIVSVLTLKKRDAFFRTRPRLARVRGVLAPIVTFHLVVLALIVFRANSLGLAMEYLGQFVRGLGAGEIAATRLDFNHMMTTSKVVIGLPLLALLVELASWVAKKPAWSQRFFAAPRGVRWAVYYGVILMTLALSRLGEEKFIYAQF